VRDLEKKPRSPSHLRQLRPALTALRLPYRLVIGLAILAFFSGIGSASVLVLLIQVGLRITGSESAAAIPGIDLSGQSIGVLFAATVGAALLVLVTDILAARQGAQILRTVQRRLRTALFRSYSNASWVTQVADPPGHLQDVMATNVSRALNLTKSINAGLVAALAFATLVVSAAIISPAATAILLISLSGLTFALMPLAQRIRDAADVMRTTNLDHAVHLAEVSGVPTEIRTFGVGEAARTRHDASVERVATAHGHIAWLEKAVPSLQRNLALIAVLSSLAVLYQTGVAEAGELGAVVVLLGRSLTYALAVQQTVNRFAADGPFVLALDGEIDRYDANIADAIGTPEDGDADLGQSGSGLALSLNSVTYRHPEATTAAVSDVSLEIAAGAYVAVVGPSGSGKTTLAEILLGLRTPSRGTYSVGGVDSRDLGPGTWSAAIAYVPQRPTIIVGTIAENVRFLRENITDTDIEAALDDAGMNELVDTLGEGDETILGPANARLSGGQLQRLAIARALAGKPDVIVLDEPTSALDPDSERAIRSTLQSLAGCLTLVVITHRAATIEGCERVVVLEAGRVIADGPPDQIGDASAFWQRGFDLRVAAELQDDRR
jgi:ATP-binding cassette subfamily B protein